jgi:hypothetical protein
MRNKLFIITSLSILLSLCLINATSLDLTSCSPTITLVNQDPITATPGSYVKLVFEISGLDYCTSGLAVELNPQYPFSLDSGADPVRVLTSKPYVAGYKSTWNVGYNVRIADDASGENYTIELLYHSGIGTDFTSSSVRKDFDISITNSLTSFDAVIQDTSSSTVSIALANTGKNAANSVIVKIPQQNNFRASSTNGQMVGNLASGDYTIVSFEISSSKSFMDMGNPPSNSENQTASSSDQNQLKIEIDYTDNIGVRRITYLGLEMPPSFSGSNSTGFSGNFPGRTNRSSWSPWYTVFIILGILIILFVIYKKFPEQSRRILGKIFKKKKKDPHSPHENEIPDWIKKEREKKR